MIDRGKDLGGAVMAKARRVRARRLAPAINLAGVKDLWLGPPILEKGEVTEVLM